MSPRELERFLYGQIPLSKALGVRVVSADDSRVELLSPLEPNHNHLGTAFGGSLAAIAVLAGYAWVFQALRARGYDAHLLLKTMTVDYEKPVSEAIRAICEAPPADDFAKFLNAFERKGVGRLKLRATIETSQGAACILNGEFVAQSARSVHIGRNSNR